MGVVAFGSVAFLSIGTRLDFNFGGVWVVSNIPRVRVCKYNIYIIHIPGIYYRTEYHHRQGILQNFVSFEYELWERFHIPPMEKETRLPNQFPRD